MNYFVGGFLFTIDVLLWFWLSASVTKNMPSEIRYNGFCICIVVQNLIWILCFTYEASLNSWPLTGLDSTQRVNLVQILAVVVVKWSALLLHFRRSEFESHWSRQFLLCKNCLKGTKINEKEAVNNHFQNLLFI